MVESVGSPAMWAGFILMVLVLLGLDLGVFHRKAHEVRVREAATWTVVWIGLALAFNYLVVAQFGAERGMEFFSGYLLEKALAVDNLFVFLVVFSYFKVPTVLLHRVLYWGILGALLLRGGFILLGAALIQQFHAVLYIFGLVLILTAIKMFRQGDDEVDPGSNPVVRLIRRLVPMTDGYRGTSFFVREGGRWLATPLLMVLVAIEVTDLVFAVDSIPAIFAITRDPFIVFTSNIFAILGLRAMFFLISAMLGRFQYLNVGLALVLGFVGMKLLLIDLVHIPTALSLGVIAVCLTGSIVASVIKGREGEDGSEEVSAPPVPPVGGVHGTGARPDV